MTDFFVLRYLARVNLNFITLHGEAASVDKTIIETVIVSIKEIMRQYNARDIFNTDETGLYVKETGNKSYVFDKKNDRSNTKKIKLE